MQTALQRTGKRSAAGGLVLLLIWMGLFGAAVLLSRWSSKEAAAPAHAAEEQGAIRLMTYNIRHAEDLNNEVHVSAILAQLEQGKADFIALQEVDRYQWRTGLQDQAAYLAKRLRMNYSFAPAFRRGLSQYGIALLSRYPLENTRIYPLPFGNGQEPRIVLTAQVRLKERLVTIVTTHLGVARSERELQMPALMDVLHAIDTPLIVMGDFNMPDSDILMGGLNRLLQKIPLLAPQATVVKGGEIDHIFTNIPQYSPAWTQYSKSSDHLPVFGQVNLDN